MKVEQPKLGRKGTMLLLIILGAFPPLTMDLYLPALPQMADVFQTSHSMVNLTLGTYMIAFAIGMLFWGPLSERTGRKPILFIALSLYIAASLLCAMTYSIEGLIAFRIVQGLAGGGVTVVGTTIVKDLFDGREREKVMATIMSLVIIAPMIAPILGAFLLKIASWHMMFVALAVFACFAACLVALYQETLEEKSTGPLLMAWGRLGVVLKNPRFAYLLLIFSTVPMCLMSFIGIAAYVYVDDFGMTEQAFGFIFAMNAAFAMLGPQIYLRLSRKFHVQNIISGCFAVIVSGGILMLWGGWMTPWIFAPIAAAVSIAVIAVRVPGVNLLLEQQSQDTGSAAALIQFSVTIMGAAGIQIVSTQSQNLTGSYGILLIVVGTVCALLWLAVQKRPFVAEKLTQLL
ncbi:DHA1 family bicyclomycin/chloramphenicol resistance-like MFS transporter [Sulfitobacter undariae]|uniref:Bcr/CflA family efflux transporter n=1 Tax=Sulfitobacter undariae TaxID=1563671 RepID=A0A7W6E285_9RHOB|nr:multidrug effflux MFS transporter [Sulfitobacter undariae]MBB3993412.1 DHA1 family bicyclomycin/chloramphenicol resistance-like MFS transporter [Sulfitobacter undariae]